MSNRPYQSQVERWTEEVRGAVCAGVADGLNVNNDAHELVVALRAADGGGNVPETVHHAVAQLIRAAISAAPDWTVEAIACGVMDGLGPHSDDTDWVDVIDELGPDARAVTFQAIRQRVAEIVADSARSR